MEEDEDRAGLGLGRACPRYHIDDSNTQDMGSDEVVLVWVAIQLPDADRQGSVVSGCPFGLGHEDVSLLDPKLAHRRVASPIQ